MSIDLTPDPDEIVQEEYDDGSRPISVTVCGPAQTRELPAARVGYRTEQAVTATIGVRLVPMEPRRKEAFLIAQSADVWISGSQAGVQAGAAAAMRIPALVPWRIGHLDEVWVCAVAGTTDVGIQCDYWSE